MPAMRSRRAREDVLGERDQVGALARLERAQLGLAPDGARVPDGERADRLVAGHALRGLPAGIGALARRRASPRRGCRGRDWRPPPGSPSRPRRRRPSPAPSARRRRPPGAPAPGARPPTACRRCSAWAACSAPRPGGRSAGCRREPGSARARRAGGAAGPASASARSNTSRTSVLARSPMACTQTWKPSAAASRVKPQHLVGRHQDQAGVRGVVAVGRVQRGAARAERTVEPELDRAHRQVAVADRLGPAALAILRPTPSCR